MPFSMDRRQVHGFILTSHGHVSAALVVPVYDLLSVDHDSGRLPADVEVLATAPPR